MARAKRLTPERANLEAHATALLELEKRARSFPLFYYSPIEKIRPFHQSSARVRILAGGNRSGKSESNAAELAAFALGYRPWILRELGLPVPQNGWIRPDTLPEEAICFSGNGVRVPVPNTCFAVTGQSMNKGIGQTMHPKLKKMLGDWITGEHMLHGGTPGDITLKNGSKIMFGSAEQGALAFESTNFTFTSIDEPIPRRVYTGIARGSVDQYAPIVMTFTPLGAWSSWIFTDLYKNARSGTDIEAFSLSIYDNPYLPRKAVEEFANDPALSEMEKEARLFGRFTHLADRVYPSFNPEVHVVPSFYIPRDWFCGMVVDPHSIRPWFIAYFAVSPRGEIYFYKEWPTEDFSKIRRDPRPMDQYALTIRELDGDRQIGIRLMDPNYGPRKDTLRGREVPSIQSYLQQFGIDFECKIEDELTYGEGRVRELLHYDASRGLDAMNHPRLYIMETCPNLIASMNLYTARTKYNSDGELEDEKREEMYKDGADVIRYVAVSEIGQQAAQESWSAAAGRDYGFFGDADYGGTAIGSYGEEDF